MESQSRSTTTGATHGALTVELFYYVLICAGISKSFGRVKVWLVVSVAYVFVSMAAGMPWQDRYYPFAAASLPFAIGSSIYFLTREGRLTFPYRQSAAVLFAFMLANCAVWTYASRAGIGAMGEIGFYINTVACTLLLYAIVTKQKILPITSKRDRAIGDYSYPMYLLHWQCGFIASMLMYGKPINQFTIQGLAVFLLAVPLIFSISWLFIKLIDRPVQRIRTQYKESVATPPQTVIPEPSTPQ